MAPRAPTPTRLAAPAFAGRAANGSMALERCGGDAGARASRGGLEAEPGGSRGPSGLSPSSWPVGHRPRWPIGQPVPTPPRSGPHWGRRCGPGTSRPWTPRATFASCGPPSRRCTASTAAARPDRRPTSPTRCTRRRRSPAAGQLTALRHREVFRQLEANRRWFSTRGPAGVPGAGQAAGRSAGLRLLPGTRARAPPAVQLGRGEPALVRPRLRRDAAADRRAGGARRPAARRVAHLGLRLRLRDRPRPLAKRDGPGRRAAGPRARVEGHRQPRRPRAGARRPARSDTVGRHRWAPAWAAHRPAVERRPDSLERRVVAALRVRPGHAGAERRHAGRHLAPELRQDHRRPPGPRLGHRRRREPRERPAELRHRRLVAVRGPCRGRPRLPRLHDLPARPARPRDRPADLRARARAVRPLPGHAADGQRSAAGGGGALPGAARRVPRRRRRHAASSTSGRR